MPRISSGERQESAAAARKVRQFRVKALGYSLHQVAHGIAEVTGGDPPSLGNLSQLERQQRGCSIKLGDRYLRWAWAEARAKALAVELVPSLHELASIVPIGSRAGQNEEESATVAEVQDSAGKA